MHVLSGVAVLLLFTRESGQGRHSELLEFPTIQPEGLVSITHEVPMI